MLDFNDLGRYDMIQRLEKANRRDEYPSTPPEAFSTFCLMIVSVIAAIVIIAGMHHCDVTAPKHCVDCHNAITHKPAARDTYKKYHDFYSRVVDESRSLVVVK